ncbi:MULTISPECIES: BlaI/MecI/CopY family transcriptional regulator [unclassified Streptomyces]|uniref:BlaI/MecI/CopY family transcriptional regulator n=1 Tax=unclassified Streptomyces TaxID=2593676 RepID=UPI000D361713|nr:MULTISPECIES: BlaI/MecI/CopY family transcriptional regulator [unclassified Streptomyces]PTM86522.1 putative transcriptional regulator [Streptomyces sp. VMFN-G11Ma]
MRDRNSGEGGAASGRRARGELESAVLGALWAADEPLTGRQVLERLPGNLAYTTVLTILSRLHAKGMLIRQPADRGYAYAPVRDEAADTAVRMHGLLERGSDRAAVLSRFVSELSPEDEQLLQRLLGGQDAGHDEDGP